jgi:protein-tyrosine phosphatase
MAADSVSAMPAVPAPRDQAEGSRDPDAPYRICVVCLGNICRSPMAEVILREEIDRAGLSERVTVESAGTGDWHVGGRIDPRAATELARRGYDGSRHIARQIQADWIGEYDLFVVMDHRNLANVRQLAAVGGGIGPADGRIQLMRSFDPAAGSDTEVPDPYHGGPAEYEETFELVHAAARGLAGRLAERLADGQPTGPGRG